MSQYYDDLSVENDCEDWCRSSSEEDCDDDSAEEDADAKWFLGQGVGSTSQAQERKYTSLSTGLWDRCILHLDLDCFYCQCEEIDRNLREVKPPRPLAIGQKHIVVTCNYEARKHGVTKLQSREAAYLACPDLWIVEGSDLLHYRRHSRKAYDAFRMALEEISNELCSRKSADHRAFKIAARKGCMDEMVADLTPAVNAILERRRSMENKLQPISYNGYTPGRKNAKDAPQHQQSRFIFGEDASSSVAVLVEDQTGAKSVVSFKPNSSGMHLRQDATLAESRRNIHDTCGATPQDRIKCQQRFEVAAELTDRVCQTIFRQTGFHTTGGISVSPLLAKIASGLNKPKSVNLLYPWRSSQLLYSMPLRKMDKIGSRTAKALDRIMLMEKGMDRNGYTDSDSAQTAMEAKKSRDMRTVRELLELPREKIRQSLQGLAAFQADTSSDDQCTLLIQQCRGLDTATILDDEGVPPKTVSAENSFRRGTVCTIEAVHKGLEDICRRLPLLIQDRIAWAINPTNAYPTTIRLTVRMVDLQLARIQTRRPYITKSKQKSIDGRNIFLKNLDLTNQSDLIRCSVTPLLQQLLPANINVTRINIAFTNFQDSIIAQAISGTGQTTLSSALKGKRPNMLSEQSVLLRKKQAKRQHFFRKAESFERNSAKGRSQPQKSMSDTTLQSAASQVSLPKECSSFTRNAAPKAMNLLKPRTALSGGKMKSTRIDHFFFKK